MLINDLIAKSFNDERLSQKEIVSLLELPPSSSETYRLFAASRELSARLSDNHAEVHAQFAINLAPCPKNCMFCSFAVKNGIFKGSSKISPEDAVTAALTFEQNGANAIYLMATASFDIAEFCDYGKDVRSRLKPESRLIANVGDQEIAGAQRLKDAGFDGVYHALRLREGSDSEINPDLRLQSIRAFREAGLIVGTCVEPVGPEHSNEELADLILFTAAQQPAFSGAARRIGIDRKSVV